MIMSIGLPLSYHTNEDSQKSYQEASISSCQSDSCTLDLSMRPVGPKPEVNLKSVRRCRVHGKGPEFGRNTTRNLQREGAVR